MPDTHPSANEPETRAAAERIAPEMASLKESDLLQISLDIPSAIAQVLGVWPSFQAYLPAIEALPGVDVERIRKLRDYTLNLYFWTGSALYATAPVSGYDALIEKGIAVRERILNDLTSLAGHGVIDAGLLAKFKGTAGHKKIGQDLVGLSNLVHERWSVIEGKSMLTLGAMDEAALLGETVMQAIGDRERSPASTSQSTAQKDRAFTLFVKAHDEARRAVQFLRWHEEDANTVLPSLYKGRAPKKRDEGERDKTAAAVGATTSSLIAPAEGSATTAAVSPNNPFATE